MSRPKCPNHTVEMDPTDQRRMWICPISGAHFEADADFQDKVKKFDKFGRPMQEWKVTQTDGTGG
jgi:hypothetical protein